MFYDTYVRLCSKAGKSPSKVAEENNLSRTSVVKWKNGSIPSGSTIQKLAAYFGISADYLINTISESSTPEQDLEHETNLEKKEKPTTELSGERLENFNLFVRKLKEHGLDLDTASEQDIDCWINIISSAKSVFDK